MGDWSSDVCSSDLASLGKFDKKKAAAVIKELGINPDKADPVTA